MTDNVSMLLLPEADTRGARGEMSDDKSVAGLHSAHPLRDRQYAILLSFSPLPPYHHVGFNLPTRR